MDFYGKYGKFKTPRTTQKTFGSWLRGRLQQKKWLRTYLWLFMNLWLRIQMSDGIIISVCLLIA